MRRQVGILLGSVALAAAAVVVPSSAQAGDRSYQWGNRDFGCDESEDVFAKLPKVQPNGRVENVQPLRIKVGDTTSTDFAEESRARVTQEATWDGLDDTVSAEPDVTWYLSKDGGTTFESITGDLGDNYVPCPRDADGQLYAVTEVYALNGDPNDHVVVARAISNPIEIRKAPMGTDGTTRITEGTYPGPAVGRPAAVVGGPGEIGDTGYTPDATQSNAWTIDGKVVSRSTTYTPPSSAWGKTLKVTSTLTAPYFLPYTLTAEGVVKRVPSMSNTTTVLGDGRVTVTAKVVVTGTSRPAGSVRILEDGREVAVIPALSNGSGSVLLKGREPGQHTYAAKYSGNSLVFGTNRYRTVTVR